MAEIIVTKRSGKKENLNFEKINKVLDWATKGITDVSASDIAMNAKLQFYEGITTKEIHSTLVLSASELISVDAPNYQRVAGRLLNYLLRKEVFYTYDNFPRLRDHLKKNVDMGIYDKILIDKYTLKEIDKIQTFIKHDRDENFTYAGLQQMMDKYLVKDRKTNDFYETPQFAYIAIAMIVCHQLEGKDKLKKIKKLYDYISLHKISLPTPIIAGVRTPNRQFSSCVLINAGDTLDSIAATTTATINYISKRAGIGIDVNIRGINSKIRNGEVVHTGVIPFVKLFEAAVKSCSQGGIRGGAATFYYPFWHKEIQDILVLKNNRGNDLNRARRVDHAIKFSKLFYQRFINKEDISLFSLSDVPGLNEAFGYNDKFDELYVKYEKDLSIPRITVPARELLNAVIRERIETGRIYIMNIDNVNTNSPFLDKISQSNLCLVGDTKIPCMIENKKMTLEISDIINHFENNKNIYVLSKNLKTNKLEYQLVTNGKLMSKNAKLMEITDDKTGNTIRCTPEHKIYTKNRGYVLAKELKEDDILDIR